LYGYVLQDPVNNIDPDGKLCMVIGSINNYALVAALTARNAVLYTKIKYNELTKGKCEADKLNDPLYDEYDKNYSLISSYGGWKGVAGAGYRCGMVNPGNTVPPVPGI
tara:strand:+ start:6704 stop:7027 length:324 start_codon:yes stop_codon:yes gene_type:complete